ncbi:MAG: hypothetical protein AAGG07_06465 [Planctomycetota bacterium]
MQKTTLTQTALAAALVTLAGQANGALKLVGTTSDTDFNVVTNAGAVRTANFSGISDPVTGIGMTGRFTFVSGDSGGGTGPWSLDVAMSANAPGGASSATFTPLGGDQTIADYPLQDGARVFGSGVAGNGSWQFNLSSTQAQAGWTYGLRDVQYHLFADAADQTFTSTVRPDDSQQWDRPFFIAGVSGLGPTAYAVQEFTVDTSGVYDFSSVLSNGGDHFSFLYSDSFDASSSLDNLLDYGLGNGFNVNGDPRGTSSFSTVLFEGETYYWVTSQWASFSTIADATNTIVGPGTVTIVPAPAGAFALLGVAAASHRRRH